MKRIRMNIVIKCKSTTYYITYIYYIYVLTYILLTILLTYYIDNMLLLKIWAKITYIGIVCDIC